MARPEELHGILTDRDDLHADASPVAAATSRRIVIVDDEDDLRMMSRIVLEQRGHKVKEARDGVDGLALILAEKPDVAIVDIGLPGMNGYEVARNVRAAVGYAVLLVALTGLAKDSDRLEALAAGFDAHMTKPVDIERVERMLQLVERTSQLYEVYSRTVGKVRSGAKLTNGDYGHKTPSGLEPYSEDEKVAVTIAAEDVMIGIKTRTKSDLVAEVQRRFS
jgi:DNA-binding response OmpR family regulator